MTASNSEIDQATADFMQRLAKAQVNRLRSDLIVWGGLLMAVLAVVLLVR